MWRQCRESIKQGARLFKDEDGKPYYRIFGKNSEGKLWLTHHLQLKEALPMSILKIMQGFCLII